MYPGSPVGEIRVEVKEAVIETVKGIVDEIEADGAKVGKSLVLPDNCRDCDHEPM